MRNENYVKAITFLAIITFTFALCGAFQILNSSLLLHSSLSSFAYMLILIGFEAPTKKLTHYIHILVGLILLILISFIYALMLYKVLLMRSF